MKPSTKKPQLRREEVVEMFTADLREAKSLALEVFGPDVANEMAFVLFDRVPLDKPVEAWGAVASRLKTLRGTLLVALPKMDPIFLGDFHDRIYKGGEEEPGALDNVLSSIEVAKAVFGPDVEESVVLDVMDRLFPEG